VTAGTVACALRRVWTVVVGGCVTAFARSLVVRLGPRFAPLCVGKLAAFVRFATHSLSLTIRGTVFDNVAEQILEEALQTVGVCLDCRKLRGKPE